MDTATTRLLSDAEVVQRVIDHVDGRTTDLSEEVWREPVENYRSPERFQAEMEVLRSRPVLFCPSAAIAEPGAFVAREAAGTPIVVTRGRDGAARAFLNMCSHRGAQVACENTGCAKALVCPYHGWTYSLEGDLKGIPHEGGFPGFDKSGGGLVPLPTFERQGAVFVSQRTPSDEMIAELDALPMLYEDGFSFVKYDEFDVATNWKIAVEGFLEGYHIRSTHPETFYPIQFDNLNVIEQFGRNNRVTFPYRNIVGLRDTPDAERRADGVLTYAYQLFPDAIVATQPGRRALIVLEPLGIGVTRHATYALSDHYDDSAKAGQRLGREESFATEGGKEDRAIITAIQRNLGSNPRTHFEFGRFEGAIAHFHRELDEVIAGQPDA
jgi:phenylpropionate dioxygenase-like ring-hydroxylating dioxygenase large terminal subunit